MLAMDKSTAPGVPRKSPITAEVRSEYVPKLMRTVALLGDPYRLFRWVAIRKVHRVRHPTTLEASGLQTAVPLRTLRRVLVEGNV